MAVSPCRLALVAAAFVICSINAHAAPYSIEVVAVGPSQVEHDRATDEILSSPEAQETLGDNRYRVLSAIGSPPKVIVYDYTADRLVRIEREGHRTKVTIESELAYGWQSAPPPTAEEFLDAVKLIGKDAVLGPELRAGRLKAYRAMPSLLDPLPDGGKRVMPVGLRPYALGLAHEIVAVDLSREKVERFTRRAPSRSQAIATTCGPDDAGQENPRSGSTGMVEITVKQYGVVIWRMTAIRAAASSGALGSGVELRDVSFKGQMVLKRAQAPILNVDYPGKRCGPFRDPVNSENAFVATGTEVAPGFIRTKQVPRTIFDTGVDRGNFWGVAIYEDSSQFVLASELSAGWYRYASEFRFAPDGTIRPLFKFSAVHNSCTCESHNHHVYWRFDFDVGGAMPNNAESLEGNVWSPVAEERSFLRNRTLAWRISNPSAGLGYELRAGPYDGTANAYGQADAWILRSKPKEIDDAAVATDTTEARIGKFADGESLDGQDIVMWYAGHIPHTHGRHETPHIAGPVIRPIILPAPSRRRSSRD